MLRALPIYLEETVKGIKEHERIDDLQIANLKLIQDKRLFCFGIDAVLLANFVKIKKDQIGADLGTGNGIIPILLAGKTPAKKIYGIEIQEASASLARRSVLLNGLEERIEILNMDLKRAWETLGEERLDFIVTNPPYIRKNSLTNPNEAKSIARHEIACSVEDVLTSGSALLKHGGNFFMVHRPNRLCDILCAAREVKLEAKEMRFIHSRAKEAPILVLIRFRKYGAKDLILRPPWIIYDEQGAYSPEILELYRDKNKEGAS